MQSGSRRMEATFLALVFGAFLGALVFAEPFLANRLSHMADLTVRGTNVFKAFEFEVTAAFFGLLVTTFLVIRVVSRYYSTEKTFVILYMVGIQTMALTTMGRFDLSEIIIIFFGFVLLVRSLDPETTITLTGIDLLNIIFLTSLILPAVNNGMVQLVDSFITGVKMVFIPFLFVNYLKDMKTVRLALRWFIIMTVISSVIAIVQDGLYIFTGYPLIGFIDSDQLKFLFEDTSFGSMLRVPAFFGTYKPFTFFLNASILLLANRLIYVRMGLKEKFYLSGAVGLMVVVVLLTFSKDALLSLFVGMALTIIIWRPRHIIHWVALVLLVLAVAEAAGFLDKAVEALHDNLTWQEDRIRVILARDGLLGFIYRHPWVGIGVRNAPRYTAHFYRWPAHNSFIQAADSGGLVGLFAYTGLIVFAFKSLFNLLVRLSRGPDWWLGVGLFTGFVSFFTMIQFHPVFLERFLWLYLGLVKALELRYPHGGDQNQGVWQERAALSPPS